ncbi:sporulation integral membrane protein YlbJ [Bacillus solimangrovi]|uniref:Sporulation integral membrane protein YlbJ n=1 Tax=Bacillus solimangrovi TaxID=1305675 RepID=A0A1E5LIP3_9BACI|nr:sporulation integral membrane protein YlbJ [Bacillus solimangrovi]OEH93953.1 sporulation integral membrane protein YlbJ [Bacillus solimangrovi]
MTYSKFKTVALSLLLLLFAVSLISYPQDALQASIRGLNMWWDVVFPSLLPFFVVSELLIGYGVVHFIGVLLEPIMRPVFRVPGSGGFVWAMGMASGFPSGAKLTARLWQENEITTVEAERLASFTNSSNPLFIFGAVAVGFFHDPKLGILLAVSHYLGNICVGLIMRFHGKDHIKPITIHPNKKQFILKEAFLRMHNTRINESRPLGKMLGDAVTSSVQTLLMIGGFIILFSVFNKVLHVAGITEMIANFFSTVLLFFSLSNLLAIPLISGLFEITLGSQMTSQTETVSLLEQAIITSFILGFSGFSVQAQVASILAETKIRFRPFFLARILQGFFSALITALLYQSLYVQLHTFEKHTKDIPVFNTEITTNFIMDIWYLLLQYGAHFTLFVLCFSIYYYFSKQLRL